MKKYHICFLLLLGAVSLCLASGFFFMQARSERYPARMEETQETGEGQQTTEPEQETETTPPEDHIADSAAEEESDAARQAAAGSGQVQAKGNFFLVSEDGFLLVFGKEPSEICLYTHIGPSRTGKGKAAAGDLVFRYGGDLQLPGVFYQLIRLEDLTSDKVALENHGRICYIMCIERTFFEGGSRKK